MKLICLIKLTEEWEETYGNVLLPCQKKNTTSVSWISFNIKRFKFSCYNLKCFKLWQEKWSCYKVKRLTECHVIIRNSMLWPKKKKKFLVIKWYVYVVIRKCLVINFSRFNVILICFSFSGKAAMCFCKFHGICVHNTHLLYYPREDLSYILLFQPFSK